MSRRFIIVTEDMSGFGWAKRLNDEGEQVVLARQPSDDEDCIDQFMMVGSGWVPTMTLDEALAAYVDRESYWIFDRNKFSPVADQLRQHGAKVFGTTSFTDRMENDRQFAVDTALQCGLPSPPTVEFTDVQEALKFLDENDQTAYVFKPNASDNNFATFVPFREDPEDANRELYHYLAHSQDNGNGFILQERKRGVEVNVEVWLYEGRPIFAMVGLENKRRWNHDLGEMSGCAGDIVFPIDLNQPLVTRTIGKMLPMYDAMRYTGFADVNVIIGDNETWFLEVCDRFGYSAHPNMFIAMALQGFGEIISDWVDGYNLGDFYSRFRQGFGASITCFADHPRPGIPLYLNPRTAVQFYPFDGYKEGDDILLAGYSSEVGIFIDHDYTIEDAAEGCLTKLLYGEAVSYPDIAFRTDLHKTDYHGAPIKRYSALRSMRLLS